MPEIPNVVAGEPVQSDWGNDVRDRITSRYADATARAASTPFPQAGQITWLDDPGVLERFDGADWRQLGEAPRVWADGPAAGTPTSPAVKVVEVLAPFAGTFIVHMTGDVQLLAADAGIEVTIGTGAVPFGSLLLISSTTQWAMPFSIRKVVTAAAPGQVIGGWIRSNNSGSGDQDYSDVTITVTEADVILSP